MRELIEEILQPAINLGLDEDKFWDMTLSEIERWINGAVWRLKAKAQFDYTLAELIGVSNSRLVSKEARFPTLTECYPNLFEEEANEQKKLQTEQDKHLTSSQNNFLAFASKLNANWKKQGVETEQK